MNFRDLLDVEGITTKVDKGEHVFMQGDSDESLYFIQSGFMKAYYISKDGKEFVKSFLAPNNTIGSLTSAYSKGNCSFSLICLEPSIMKQISFKIVLKYSKNDLQLANNMVDMLLQFAMKKEQREFELLCLSAEQRFRKIIQTSPMLLEKVTQNDLALYLGVTPVGLSRIKKRVY